MEVRFLPLTDKMEFSDNHFIKTINGVRGIVLNTMISEGVTGPIRVLAEEKLYSGSWMTKKLVFGNSLLEKMFVTNMITSWEALSNTAKAIYGDKVYVNDTFKTVDIHYPEIVITNTLGLEHTIRDLVINMSFVTEGPFVLRLSSIIGRRYTLTDKELRGLYSHSHLPAGSQYEFRDFCVGSNTIMEKFMSSQTNMNNHDENNWGAFFLQIDKYLAWESLEGNPYVAMSTLADPRGGGVVPSYHSSSDHSRLLGDLAKEVCGRLHETSCEFIRCIFNIGGTRYAIDTTGPSYLEYLRLIHSFIDNSYYTSLPKILYDRARKQYAVDMNGQEVSVTKAKFLSSGLNNTFDLVPQIISEDGLESSLVTVYHPYAVIEITNQVERILNEGAFFSYINDKTKDKDLASITSADPAVAQPLYS